MNMKLPALLFKSILLVLLFVVVGTAVIFGWSIGIGWLLTLFLPFSWFEASLLLMVASIAIGALGVRMLLSMPPALPPMTDSESLFDPPIASDRFYSSGERVTFEAWFRFEMANDIFWELTDTPSIVNSMDERETKELAIRLTDIAVNFLKNRKSGAYRVKVSKNQLMQQMKKMQLRPYDDDILEAAADAITLRLSHDEMMADIVRDQSWDEIDPDL